MKFQHFSTLLSFVLLLLFCLGVSSCKKDEWDGQTTWTGTVRMLGTKESIPNIKLKLYAVLGSGSFLGSTSWTLLEEKYSKADGGFSFEYLDPKDGTYYVIVPEANYYFINSSNYTRVLNGNPEITEDVIMHPYAWVRVRIKSTPPFEWGNVLYLSNLNGVNPGVFHGNPNYSNLDTTIVGYVPGNDSSFHFTYGTTSNSNDMIGTIFPVNQIFPALDTSDLYIEF